MGNIPGLLLQMGIILNIDTIGNRHLRYVAGTIHICGFYRNADLRPVGTNHICTHLRSPSGGFFSIIQQKAKELQTYFVLPLNIVYLGVVYF